MNKFVMIPHEQFLKFKKYLEIEKHSSNKSNTAEEESEQLNNVTSSKAEIAMRAYICHPHQECLRVV